MGYENEYYISFFTNMKPLFYQEISQSLNSAAKQSIL
jgi:hypothetical protein